MFIFNNVIRTEYLLVIHVVYNRMKMYFYNHDINIILYACNNKKYISWFIL